LSGRRSWREEHSVDFIDVFYVVQPVFHACSWGDDQPHRQIIELKNGQTITEDSYTSVCGLVLSTYRTYSDESRGYFSDKTRASLPVNHAMRFGRPCKKCFYDAEEAS
jgi:hypothetical protein